MTTARISFPLVLLFSASCMSFAPRPQSVSLDAVTIDTVPARRWADNHCAAGALSEVLNHLGDVISAAALGESLTAARGGGVVTVDLLLAARNRGFDAELIRGDRELIGRELENRRPLILMLRVMDAPGTEDDLFHYVVISGIDRTRNLFRMHYGDGKQRWIPLDPLNRSWAAAGYATLVIGPRTARNATKEDLRRAVVLEEQGKIDEAIALYRQFVAAHPRSSLGWTNLANAHARAGEHRLAETEYCNALFVEPHNVDALNNLASLLLQQERLDEAEQLARRAVEHAVHDRDVVMDTLNQIVAKKKGDSTPRQQDVPRPPSSVQRQEESRRGTRDAGRGTSLKPYWTMYAWLTAATIYDIEATFYRLDNCRECREGNPVLRPLIESGRLATYAYSAAVNGTIMYVARHMFDSGDPWWRVTPMTFALVHAIAGTRNLYLGARGKS